MNHNSLQLTAGWDLTVDGSRNLSMLSGPAAVAQDVASAISTFLGEVYYDTTQGIPFFADVLGQAYSPSLLRALLVQAALTVPDVVQAQAKITGFQNRKITGVVNIIDTSGQALGVTF